MGKRNTVANPNQLISARFPFSKSRLESLPVPDTGRRRYRDEKSPGLCLTITAAGSRTFYWYRKVNGDPQEIPLGKFPETTIEQARTIAASKNGKVADGKDPAAERRAARQVPTFAELFQWWLESHAKPRLRSWKESERLYKTYLDGWKSRRLSAIKRADVQRMHVELGTNNGKYQANRVLSLIKTLFAKAPDFGWSGDNPAKGAKKFREESRDRFLLPDELPRFFRALSGEPSAVLQAFFLVCLLTGARRGNVQRMRWEEIDFTLLRWRIPQTKSGVVVVVPLSEPVVGVLRDLREKVPSEEWVFPAVRQGKKGTPYLSDPMPAWRRLTKRAGLENLRIHDLRRTLGSWQALTGASLQVIGKSLGHSRPETTAIYSRLTMDPVRQSVETATAAMLAAGTPKETEG